MAPTPLPTTAETPAAINGSSFRPFAGREVECGTDGKNPRVAAVGGRGGDEQSSFAADGKTLAYAALAATAGMEVAALLPE